MLAKAPPTALDAIISNNNQLSGLAKAVGHDAVDAAIAMLLKRVLLLTLSPVNDDQALAMAQQIRTNFWHYRFEELQYVMNKGINGGYRKDPGHLHYEHIAGWLKQYESERDKALEEHRRITHERAVKPIADHEWNPRVLDEMKRVFEASKESIKKGQDDDRRFNEQMTEEEKARAHAITDGQKRGIFHRNKYVMTDDDLKSFLHSCIDKKFSMTRVAVEEEMKRRNIL